LGKLKISIAEFVCLSSFHKVWVLALHGFSLLICLKPLGHDSPHRKEILNELIHRRSKKKSYYYVSNVFGFGQLCVLIL
jgi:hypothetical protein